MLWNFLGHHFFYENASSDAQYHLLPRDSYLTITLQCLLGQCTNTLLDTETLYAFPISMAPYLTLIGLVSMHSQWSIVVYILLLNTFCMDSSLWTSQSFKSTLPYFLPKTCYLPVSGQYRTAHWCASCSTAYDPLYIYGVMDALHV